MIQEWKEIVPSLEKQDTHDLCIPQKPTLADQKDHNIKRKNDRSNF